VFHEPTRVPSLLADFTGANQNMCITALHRAMRGEALRRVGIGPSDLLALRLIG
jgi:hypothetical protein